MPISRIQVDWHEFVGSVAVGGFCREDLGTAEFGRCKHRVSATYLVATMAHLLVPRWQKLLSRGGGGISRLALADKSSFWRAKVACNLKRRYSAESQS